MESKQRIKIKRTDLTVDVQSKKIRKLKREISDRPLENVSPDEPQVFTKTKKKTKKKRRLEETSMTVEGIPSCHILDEENLSKKRKVKDKPVGPVVASEKGQTQTVHVDGKLKKKKKDMVKENRPTLSTENMFDQGASADDIVRERKKKKKEKHSNVTLENLTSGQVPVGESLSKQKKQKDMQLTKTTARTPEETSTNRKRKSAGDTRLTEGVTSPTTVGTEQGRKRKKSPKDKEEHNGDQENPTQTNQDKDMCIMRPQTAYSNSEIANDEDKVSELRDYFPRLDSKTPYAIGKMIRYDLQRFREFRSQGISLRFGRFTMQENVKLKQNVEDFMALVDIDDPGKLFWPKRLETNEKQTIVRLKKQYRFYERIADGIPRACHEVFIRGRKVFDDFSKGVFTEDEDKALCKWQKIHGNNWQEISMLTGRSAYSLEKRFSHMSKKKGPWTEAELHRLQRALRDHLASQLEPEVKRISREKLYCNLPWKEVARKVKKRNWTQCRAKWMNMLKQKMSTITGSFRGKRSLQAKIRLIKAMYAMEVEDCSDVNWEDLTHTMGDVPPAYVQERFHRLKVSRVPLWQSMCFGDVIDFLYEKVLPVLEEELGSVSDEAVMEGQQETFILSDIFSDISEDGKNPQVKEQCDECDEDEGACEGSS